MGLCKVDNHCSYASVLRVVPRQSLFSWVTGLVRCPEKRWMDEGHVNTMESTEEDAWLASLPFSFFIMVSICSIRSHRSASRSLWVDTKTSGKRNGNNNSNKYVFTSHGLTIASLPFTTYSHARHVCLHQYGHSHSHKHLISNRPQLHLETNEVQNSKFSNFFTQLFPNFSIILNFFGQGVTTPPFSYFLLHCLLCLG